MKIIGKKQVFTIHELRAFYLPSKKWMQQFLSLSAILFFRGKINLFSDKVILTIVEHDSPPPFFGILIPFSGTAASRSLGSY